ncbi:two-component response regulator [Streptococcus pyogenes]|nr:two-component response regulator [Streptococcus pyogenes]
MTYGAILNWTRVSLTTTSRNLRKKMTGIPLKTITGMGYLLGERE